jgi:hypothetical protein
MVRYLRRAGAQLTARTRSGNERTVRRAAKLAMLRTAGALGLAEVALRTRWRQNRLL